MKILLLTAREPVRGGRGDQHRAWCLARELSTRHEVTILLLGLEGDADPGTHPLPQLPTIVRGAGRARRARAVLRGVLRGVPGQVAWTRAGLSDAELERRAADHDVVIAITSRSLLGPIGCPTVLDHIDALSLNMSRRAGIDPSPVRRVAARLEARLFRGHERRLATWLAAQMVTTEADAEVLPESPAITVLPPWTDLPLIEDPSLERPVDVILTGNMRYPPNRAAYRVLVDEILPVLLDGGRIPRVRVVGRDADQLPAAPGVEIAASVPSITDELEQAKVAIAPVDGGTGAPTKVIEAAACGCAVVGPAWALAAYGIDLPGSEGGAAIGVRVRRLLDDDALRASAVSVGTAAARERDLSAVLPQVEPLLLRVARRRD